ncbi:M48 family metalloprotease [Pelagerythrobacter marinus]|uniref:M48 family metalloprotease n=1 Tax=Pelagerythrobacter marinus TaxID=538382 RepID=A0ABW9UYQ4_9SPHN|nr:M48 family metalloprotease [Pelagerythrobacter marinus]MEC9068232.1 M48 family metalloprotease [Pseudomonadota bacterium]MXO68925.1 M48 family metalloprotease [Pelagerythrobacter marinus]USA39222.1 M48 family metalloprotease [Pelagerythrobacter marinus]WPZ06691.1 M48 family metalloprotease [Pelagerythrobacter marinus]
MRLLARILALVAALSLAAQPAAAQSILRDAETEALLDDMAAPLVEASGLQPGNVEIVLINDSSINAFVAGGQAVYIHTGLIDAADTANEVQGVIAHELGHITGGHIIRHAEGAGAATNISLLSLLLGVGAALAGAGEAAMGVMMAGQQAALGKYLAFSRVQESSADAAGAEYLSKAGISGRGSLAFFAKLQNQEFRYGYSQSDDAAFARTHPLSGDRIAHLREVYQADPAWDAPDDPALQRRFERVKAKLFGYQQKPQRTLQVYPETMSGIPARYARAYAWHKDAQMDRALAETDALLAAAPDDPYFLELKGQILLESGQPEAALGPLRRASELTRHQPLIASMFGHALIATENRDHFEEAEQVLRAAVARDRLNPFAWYQLGVVYAARGDMPRARLASAEQQVMSRQYAMAIRSAQAAEAGLPEGSADWIRAQDIALQARAALEREQDRR